MGAKKLFENVLKNPIRNGYIGSIAAVTGLIANYLKNDELPSLLPTLVGGFGAFTGTTLLTIWAQNFARNLGGLSIKKIEKGTLKSEPTFQFKGEKEIKYNLIDYARLFFAKNPQSVAKIARKTKNPLIALDAMILYSGKYDDFSEGITLLRDAFDWLEEKEPKLSLSTKLSQFNQSFAFSFARFFNPYQTEMYLLQAMHASITNPKKAYYWSEIARSIAKETNKLVQESYLLHALLATAQKRTDEETAWEDALTYCDTIGARSYIGESQNPVWKIEKSELLKSTIVLKSDAHKENLELERKGAKNLEKILENAKPPTPLFISNTPFEGNYIYVMRTAEGELLYDRLESNNKTGINYVEETLAQIHAKYPLDGLSKLNLEQKIHKKIKDLKLDEDFAKALIISTEPVRKAINETGKFCAAKDAHPENWIMAHTVYVLDTLFKEIQPTSLDLANLYNYGAHFTSEQKRERVMNYNSLFSKYAKEETKSAQLIFREYWNAEIQRAIDLSAAWMTPRRKGRHKHIIPLLERAQFSIQNIKQDDNSYFEQNKKEYDSLHVLIDKLKDHITPYIS